MIWVLIVLAAAPLAMGAIMLFILRSGALHRIRERGDGRGDQSKGS